MPPDDQDVTPEQLACMKALRDAGLAPYADFSIFGPHGNRFQKLQRASGLMWNTSGNLVKESVPGPASYTAWEACYICVRTCFIMLDMVDLRYIGAFMDMVKAFDSFNGPEVWPLLHQTDVRNRSERFERLRRQAEYERSLAIGPGSTHPYDPSKHWK